MSTRVAQGNCARLRIIVGVFLSVLLVPWPALAGQNDAMAMGARKAFQELPNEMDRDRWLKLPFIGCDGLPNTGQAWVRTGQLAATVFVPPNTGQAIEMIVDAIQNKKQPPAKVLVAPRSIPALNVIQARKPG